MQSNIDCIMDDLNQFPDSWVELFNSDTTTVNLNEYSIGITSDASSAWQLPSENIASNGHAIIFCDKEATGLHTNFKLESGKNCCVYLFHNGLLTDSVVGLKKQPAPNIAYGRTTDGADTWGYQEVPTPTYSNCGIVLKDILGEPVFSEPGRVMAYSQVINLTLSLPDDAPEGTDIRITYDGSEPTQSSLLYKGDPITFSTNRIVRAKLFKEGYLSRRSTAHSYLFLGREVTLPVVSLITNNSYLNDNKIGIYVDGTYSSSTKNYSFNWRRPFNFEYFEDADVPSALNQLIEARIQGNATRSCSLKSMALFANKRFGKKRLEYEFFPDQRPGVTDFKSIIIRNAGNDFDYLYMRDAIIQRVMGTHQDLDWQAWHPAIIFINGTYKGILNFRDRSNEDNVYTNHNGVEDIDMIENGYELKNGTWDNFNAFKEFYTEHGHTMAEYDERMDCIEYINIMAMNLYYNNQDFPGNNLVCWRPREEGGRWRWISKDTDFGLGLYGSSATYQTITWLYNPNYDSNRAWANKSDHTRLFRRLMEDADFNREFIDRCAIYMGDFMNEKGTRAIWDPMYELIKTEYPNHRKLINQWWPNYSSELASAQTWVKNRTASFYSQLQSYYSLGALVPLTINSSVSDEDLNKVNIMFNGVRLSEGKFDGKFFTNRTIKLTSSPKPNEYGEAKQVTGWDLELKQGANTVSKQHISTTEYTFNMPGVTQVNITACLEDCDGIEEIILDDNNTSSSSTSALYDLQGRRQDTMHSGQVYLVRKNDGSAKKIYCK